MRVRAETLLQDLIAAGNPDLDYVAALSRRVALLADSPRPLLFGRIDEEIGGDVAYRPSPRRGRPGRPCRHRLAGAGRGALLPSQSPRAAGSRAAAPDHGGPPRGRRRRRRHLRRQRRGGRFHPTPRRRCPAGRARTGAYRRDARHRRHDPGRAGRDHPCATGPAPHRAGRTGHREDGGGAAPRRLPALQPPCSSRETACSCSARAAPFFATSPRSSPRSARRRSCRRRSPTSPPR